MHVAVLFHSKGSKVAGENIVAVLVSEIEGNVVLIVQAAEFAAELDVVAALDPGQAVAELEHAVLVDAGVAVWVGLSAQEVTDVEHGAAAQAVLRRSGKPRNAEARDDRVTLGRLREGESEVGA